MGTRFHVDVTEAEMVKLYEMAVRPRTLRATYGRRAIEACESNRWAIDALVEMRRKSTADEVNEVET